MKKPSLREQLTKAEKYAAQNDIRLDAVEKELAKEREETREQWERLRVFLFDRSMSYSDPFRPSWERPGGDASLEELIDMVLEFAGKGRDHLPALEKERQETAANLLAAKSQLTSAYNALRGLGPLLPGLSSPWEITDKQREIEELF